MRNPYQPPEAALADVADADPAVRPRGVRLAVQLLWGTMAIGFVLALIDVFKVLGQTPSAWANVGIMLGAVTVLFAISFWVYGAVYAGRNWARIVVLVLTIVWALIVIAILVMLIRWAPQIPAEAKREFIINAVQFSMTIVATVLLFTPSANRWYRAVKAARV